MGSSSGGKHLYFTAPPGVELHNTQGEHGTGLGWCIDTRAAGGYVVAAGSTVDGNAYTADDTAPATLPAWIAEKLQHAPPPPAPTTPVELGTGRHSRYLHAAIDAETARVRHAPAGQRNGALYVAACALGQLAAGGALADDDVHAALLDAAADHITAGAYSHRQARATITSGLRAGANRPRKVAA